jgi:hypothetical protein
MRISRTSLIIAAVAALPFASARAQSGSFCANAADSSRVIATGPVRIVARAFGDLRVCLTASGFTDSATVHPREWANYSTLLAFETSRPGDTRRLEMGAERNAFTVNGQPRAADTVWRENVYAVIEAQWNIVALHEQVRDLERESATTDRQQKAMTAEIDTLTRRSAILNSQITDLNATEAAFRATLTREERAMADLDTQLGRERNTASTSGDPRARQAAEQRIQRLEDQIRRQDTRVRAAERRLMDLDASKRIGFITLELRSLNAENRITLLKLRLADLDAEARIAGIRTQLASLKTDERVRRLEAQLDQAVAKLTATLQR